MALGRTRISISASASTAKSTRSITRRPAWGKAKTASTSGAALRLAGDGLADAAEVVQQLAPLVLDLLPVRGQQPAARQQLGQVGVLFRTRGQRVRRLVKIAVLADGDGGDRAGGALRLQVEAAQREQAPPLELQAHRLGGRHRENVEDVAAPRQVTADLHRLARLVAQAGQLGDQLAALPQVAGADLQHAGAVSARFFEADGERRQRRQHDHLPARGQVGLQLLLGRDAPGIAGGVDVGVLEGQQVGMDGHVVEPE